MIATKINMGKIIKVKTNAMINHHESQNRWVFFIVHWKFGFASPFLYGPNTFTYTSV